jgi:diguanylate cyclase (GGDEF)-like protein/PAS domain S-box-containing protein
LCITDIQGDFIRVNQAWVDALGYSVEKIEGSNFFDFVHPEDKKDTEQALKKLKEEGQILNFVNRYQTEAGDYHYLEWRSRRQGDKIYAASRDITERREQEEEIKYISYHDTLTGLYNRYYLEEKIRRLDEERQLPISVMMADLNGLKMINDTYGHAQGDKVLIKTAKILESACRSQDIVARWGGDEFIIYLSQTENKAAQKIYDRIKKLFSETKSDEIAISIGLGVATKRDQAEDIYEVLSKAEEKMYKNKLDETRSTKSSMVKTLLKTLGENSNETEIHAYRMQKLAFLLGEKLNLCHAELDRLSLLATLHDIGKIAISAEILTKPGKLTGNEWEKVKKHPEVGYRIASATDEFAHVAMEIFAHHERWDGTGYPKGLKEDEIPPLARIISVIDAYDVMTNERSYSEAIPQAEALVEIEDCSGSQFAPEIAAEFVELIRNMDFKKD